MIVLILMSNGLLLTSRTVRISLNYQITIKNNKIFQNSNTKQSFLEYENFTNGVIDPGEQ